MAWTSGTASNYKELLSITATFAAANGHDILEQTETKLYLRGEGESGLDEIYFGIEAFENSTAGYYNWRAAGSWSWRAGRSLGSHPMSSAIRYMYLWNTSIPYWMVGHAGRIIVVAKVGTVAQMLYIGFGLPPATDAQYPHPLIVGSCGTVEAQKYTVTGSGNSMFWAGNGLNGVISRPGGDWDQIGPAYCPPKSISSDISSVLVRALDGSYLGEEIFITDANRPSIYGALDGIIRVSGDGNSFENIITIDGVNYVAVPDVYRIGIGDFCAVKLA